MKKLSVFILTLFILGCGSGSNLGTQSNQQPATQEQPEQQPDPIATKAASMKSSIPAAGANSISVSSVIEITFDEAVDAGSASLENISVMQNGIALSGTISNSGSVLRFIPAVAFDYDSLITVSIANLSDTQGKLMNGIISFAFHTESAPDLTSPFALSTSPNDGDTGVGISPVIKVTVNEAVAEDKVLAELSDGTDSIDGTLSYDSTLKEFSFTPAHALPFSTKIYFTLANVTDLAGNKSDISVSFDTLVEPDTTPPEKPVLSMVSGARATVSWTSVDEASFLLKRSARPIVTESDFENAETVSVSSSSKSFTIPNVGIGDDIYLALKVFDAAGNGSEFASLHFVSGNIKSYLLEDLSDSISNDYFGYTVAGGCHIDSDSLTDYIVASPYDDVGGTDIGRVFVYLGDKKVTINGVDSYAANASDYFGYSVSCNMDFNNDGFDDILIGAPMEDTMDGTTYSANSGATYLFYGRDFTDGTVLSASQADVIFQGRTAADRFGNNVAFVGDLNNDHFADIAITAPFSEIIQADEGVVYIYYGKALTSGSTVYDISADVKIAGVTTGTSGGLYGTVQSGDIDGDTISDLAFFAGTYPTKNRGSVYVWLGKHGLPSYIDFGVTPPDVKIVGKTDDEYLGSFAGVHPALSISGDLNDDGINDLIIGDENFDPTTGANAGSVFVFYGRASWETSYTLDKANVTINGSAANDQIGADVSVADYNKDGISDLLIGANTFVAGGSKGAAFIIYGSEDLPASINILNSDVIIAQTDYPLADIKVDNLHASDSFGSALSFVGDINGDGYEDILIGAYANEASGRPTNSGGAFLIK